MKRQNLKQLALMGMISGLVVSGQLKGAEIKNAPSSNTSQEDPNDGNLGYYLMSEQDLLLELSPEAAAQYKSLPPEGKALARKVASMRCAKTNPCKGLNACGAPGHDCMGKGSCQGTGKCGLADKNMAIKLVYDKLQKEKMTEKRNNAQNPQK